MTRHQSVLGGGNARALMIYYLAQPLIEINMVKSSLNLTIREPQKIFCEIYTSGKLPKNTFSTTF